MGIVLCVNNNKGGVLKTTTTSNLAGVLSYLKKKVLVVDADNQSNVSISFGLNPDNFRTTIYDVLVGGVPVEDTIVKIDKYIDLVPSNLDLVSFEFDVIGNPNKYPKPFLLMKDALDHLRDQYDYILIDTPPSLSLMNGNVFSFADNVIIPFEPEAYAMRSLMAVTTTVNDFKGINPNLEIMGVIFTKVVHNANLHEVISQETKKYAFENGYKTFETVIPRTVQYANSIGFDRKPVTISNRKSEKSQLYFSLWNEIENTLKVVK
ncbi:chromosome partitioning protein [Neobacillus niacini]|uniref:ParA family protein n=1 Tax=Neobacillus driksii TaxID=3035913 RepID=UPI00277EE68D|nr:AAA family ATPase [Neobacillus niacini]MDQ0976653.1 chromosome partitioning protein [Neobacillus niacini]